MPSQDSGGAHPKRKKSEPKQTAGQLWDEFRLDIAKAESDVAQIRQEADDKLQADLKQLKKRQRAGHKRREKILTKYQETGDPRPVISSTNALRANKAKLQSEIVDLNQRESDARTELNRLKNVLKGFVDRGSEQGRS